MATTGAVTMVHLAARLLVALKKKLRRLGQDLSKVKQALLVPREDWVGRSELRLTELDMVSMKLPCAVGIVSKDEAKITAVLMITSVEGVSRAKGADLVVLDKRHYYQVTRATAKQPPQPASHAAEAVSPPPPPQQQFDLTTRDLVFGRAALDAMGPEIFVSHASTPPPEGYLTIDELEEDLRSYQIMLADAAVIAELAPRDVCLMALAYQRWKEFGVITTPKRRMRIICLYAIFVVVRQPRPNRQAWYALERTLAHILSANLGCPTEGTVAVPLVDWLGCGGVEGIEANAVPRAVFNEVVLPYTHARELELWTEARTTARNVLKPPLPSNVETLLGHLLTPIRADSAADYKVARSIKVVTSNVEANAAWVAAVTRAVAARSAELQARGMAPTGIVPIDDIEDLVRHGPPCMQAIITQARKTHHLKDYDRFTMVPWLFTLGITDTKTIATFLTDTGPSLESRIDSERGRWARAGGRRPMCVGCSRIRRDMAAKEIGPGNAVRCPFTTTSECIRAAGLPPETRIVSPPDFVRAHADAAAITAPAST